MSATIQDQQDHDLAQVANLVQEFAAQVAMKYFAPDPDLAAAAREKIGDAARERIKAVFDRAEETPVIKMPESVSPALAAKSHVSSRTKQMMRLKLFCKNVP